MGVCATYIDFETAAAVVAVVVVAAVEQDSVAATHEHEGWHPAASRSLRQGLLGLLELIRPWGLRQTGEASHRRERLVALDYEAFQGPWRGQRRLGAP